MEHPGLLTSRRGTGAAAAPDLFPHADRRAGGRERTQIRIRAHGILAIPFLILGIEYIPDNAIWMMIGGICGGLSQMCIRDRNVAKHGNASGKYFYKVIVRENEYVVLQYCLTPQYHSAFLREHFIGPQNVMIIMSVTVSYTHLDVYKRQGYQKKNAVLSDQEKKVVAYHEIGHALVAALQSHSAPVQKITIIPRTSGALGYTMQVEQGDKYLMTKKELENMAQ